MLSREQIILDYLDTLPFAPYPVQEEAMLAWADCEGGVLMSAPTGTGKTLVAETCVYEGLKLGRRVYYSTPLIALTDQKLLELQATVGRWGYPPETVGLVTGNRSVNPEAPILVVVAEVLLNRLLHPEQFDFADVESVVMDEFHNFNEPQRGIVWELSLSLLPTHVRVMLLSATVGSAFEFVSWMQRSLNRNVTLVEGKERKVPLAFNFIGDELLPDFLEKIAKGTDAQRRTPALVFCFDRNQCWDIAEVLKGKDLFAEGQRAACLKRLDDFDFSVGAGNKLRVFLARGIGIHHAGLLPRYRRVVEILFQEKLLPFCICTETLAAGINLPARSSILTTLVKGPRDKKKIIDTGSAQQMFGRAGRPQFDTEGNVYAVAHEDDVKIAKWKEKLDQIPEDTKDLGLMQAKKQLLKKKPTRRTNVVYWNAEQFTRLQTAPAAKLASRGRLSWRWIAYLLELDNAVESIRRVVRQRLMDQPTIDAELKRLTTMLVTLHRLNIVILDPPPPASWLETKASEAPIELKPSEDSEEDENGLADVTKLTLGNAVSGTSRDREGAGRSVHQNADAPPGAGTAPRSLTVAAREEYEPRTATPTDRLAQLMTFRAVHPLYGLFLLDYLGKANDAELIQILESLLEMPGSVAKNLRVPRPEYLEPGPLTLEVIDPAILTRGILSAEDLYPPEDQSDIPPEQRKYPIPLAEKMRLLFESEIDHGGGLFVTPVWAIGELLAYGGKFDQFVRSRDLTKQEGILFKHALRMILLCREFEQLTPKDIEPDAWRQKLATIAETLTQACTAVDPQSTDEILEELEESGA